MIVDFDGMKFDLQLTAHGWTYVGVVLYEPERNWFKRFFDIGRVFSTIVLTSNGFNSAYTLDGIRNMTKDEFSRKIVEPTFKAYRHHLNVLKSWE